MVADRMAPDPMASDRPSIPVIVMQATALALAGAVAFLILQRFDPNSVGNRFPKCVFFSLTGLWCPGCGMTRAVHALAHADFARAFSMNPLMMTLLAISPVPLSWHWGWRPRAFVPVMRVLAEPKVWLVLLPGFWIARNLPWWPFTLLAPG
jgi:hypothetical protein